jgi:anti-anti-sigma regulatory factor
MLRIADVHNADGTTTLRLEGKLVGPWVEELRRTAEILAGRTREPLVIDLAMMTFADQAGIELLRELARLPATFISCSPFASAQLRDVVTPNDME